MIWVMIISAFFGVRLQVVTGDTSGLKEGCQGDTDFAICLVQVKDHTADETKYSQFLDK